MPNKLKKRMKCIYGGSLRTRKNEKRVISPVSFDRRTKRKVQRYECGKIQNPVWIKNAIRCPNKISRQVLRFPIDGESLLKNCC